MKEVIKTRKICIVTLLLMISMLTSFCIAPTQGMNRMWQTSNYLYFVDTGDHAYDFSVRITGEDVIYQYFSATYTVTFTLDSVNPVLRYYDLDWVGVTKAEVAYGYYHEEPEVIWTESVGKKVYEGDSASIAITVTPSRARGDFCVAVLFYFVDSVRGDTWTIYCDTSPRCGLGCINAVFPWFVVVIPIVIAAIAVGAVVVYKKRSKGIKPTVSVVEPIAEPVDSRTILQEVVSNVCGNCGAELLEKTPFCPYCGNPVRK